MRKLLADNFHFETDYFEIPSERWKTSLAKKLSGFAYKYDRPDCLAITYYAGHGYIGHETDSLKLAAKWQADGDGDPTVFLNDILAVLRLPACDQLLILDCCFAAKAFARHHLGERKFELLASAGAGDVVPSPKYAGSFTTNLNRVLSDLLQRNPKGFYTSHLYRELYHADSKVKPWLFDQARRSYDRIWLRPQNGEVMEDNKPEKGKIYLKMTLELDKEPEDVMMNELAMSLQYLPHVDQIRIEDLFSPKEQTKRFSLGLSQAQKLRPLIRQLHVKRTLQKFKQMAVGEGVEHPSTFVQMLLDQSSHLKFDLGSTDLDSKGTNGTTTRAETQPSSWPAIRDERQAPVSSVSNRLVSLECDINVLTSGLRSVSFCQWFPAACTTKYDPPGVILRYRSPSATSSVWRRISSTMNGDANDIWFLIMWCSVVCVVVCMVVCMLD